MANENAKSSGLHFYRVFLIPVRAIYIFKKILEIYVASPMLTDRYFYRPTNLQKIRFRIGFMGNKDSLKRLHEYKLAPVLSSSTKDCFLELSSFALFAFFLAGYIYF